MPRSSLTALLLLAAACDATIGSSDEVGESESESSESESSDTTDEVPTCSTDGDCDEGQICTAQQVCSTPPVNSDCEPGALSWDGCPSNAICLADPDPEVDAQACHTMPPCAADDTCPVGVYGAVCNTGYLPDKDAICLIGVCDTVAHCPANWFCVRYAENDPLGLCSAGGFGEACSQPGDCLSGMCFIPIPGLGGFCQ